MNPHTKSYVVCYTHIYSLLFIVTPCFPITVGRRAKIRKWRASSHEGEGAHLARVLRLADSSDSPRLLLALVAREDENEICSCFEAAKYKSEK